MTFHVFSVYDLKALNYGVPFFMSSVGGAIRAFADLAVDAQSAVAKHPSDYVLFKIGEYDDSSGVMLSLDKHVHLGMGSDFIVKVPSGVDAGMLRRVEPLDPVLNGGN